MKPLLLGLLTVSTVLSGSVKTNYRKASPVYNHHFSVDQAYDYAFQNDPLFFPILDEAETGEPLRITPESREIENGQLQYKKGEQGANITHAEYNFVARDNTAYPEESPIIVSDNLKDTNDKQVNANFTNTACSNMPYASDKGISPAISDNKIT